MLQFPIAMTPRTEPARALAWLSPVIAFALTVFTGFCLFAALGQDPVKALGVFFIAPLDSLRGWTEIAVKMTPLLLCAAGLVVCFKAERLEYRRRRPADCRRHYGRRGGARL